MKRLRVKEQGERRQWMRDIENAVDDLLKKWWNWLGKIIIYIKATFIHPESASLSTQTP